MVYYLPLSRAASHLTQRKRGDTEVWEAERS